MTMKLVLASASPRRRSLLKLLDLEFEIADADIDERMLDNEDPAQMKRINGSSTEVP